MAKLKGQIGDKSFLDVIFQTRGLLEQIQNNHLNQLSQIKFPTYFVPLIWL